MPLSTVPSWLVTTWLSARCSRWWVSSSCCLVACPSATTVRSWPLMAENCFLRSATGSPSSSLNDTLPAPVLPSSAFTSVVEVSPCRLMITSSLSAIAIPLWACCAVGTSEIRLRVLDAHQNAAVVEQTARHAVDEHRDAIGSHEHHPFADLQRVAVKLCDIVVLEGTLAEPDHETHRALIAVLLDHLIWQLDATCSPRRADVAGHQSLAVENLRGMLAEGLQDRLLRVNRGPGDLAHLHDDIGATGHWIP